MNTPLDTHPLDTDPRDANPLDTHPIVRAAWALFVRAAKAARTLLDALTSTPRPPRSNPEAVEEHAERAHIARRAFYAACWLGRIHSVLCGDLKITYNPRPKPGQIRPQIIVRLDLPRLRDRAFEPIRPLKRGQIDPYLRRMITTKPLGDVIAKFCRYIGLSPADPAYPHKLAAIPSPHSKPPKSSPTPTPTKPPTPPSSTKAQIKHVLS